MSTLAVRTRWLVSDSLALAGRNLEHVRQIPEKLLDVTLQPIMFVLLFAFVFGGVIDVPGGDYKEYLIGGILVQTLAFGMMGPGVSIATDLGEGMVDRFRSLPTSRSAYLVGHFIAELAATIVGDRRAVADRLRRRLEHPRRACSTRSPGSRCCPVRGRDDLARHADRRHRPLPDAVQGIAFMTVFPLTFLSNAFVPADGSARRAAAGRRVEPGQRRRRRRARRCSATRRRVPADAPWPLKHPVLAAVLWSRRCSWRSRSR